MKKFAVALNCMDGRVHIPIIEYIKNKYNIDYVDLITAPGIDKILAEGDVKIVEFIKKNVEISIKFHNSKLLFISAHYDCAGNPVNKEMHLKHILSGIENIKLWGFNIKVIGLWVDENWNVFEIE